MVLEIEPICLHRVQDLHVYTRAQEYYVVCPLCGARTGTVDMNIIKRDVSERMRK